MTQDTPCPEVSVIIPVWNGEGQIGLCLDALSRQTLDGAKFEVIVVDNGSTDGTVPLVQVYSNVRLLIEEKPGAYSARNRALAEARGHYVTFTDADCIPEPDWLERALESVEAHPEAGVIAGEVTLFQAQESDSRTCAAYEQFFTLNQAAYAASGHCATANWTSRTELLRRLGGFDASLKSGGDFELASRIAAAGYPIVYCSDVVVRHPTRGGVRDALAKRLRVHGGRWTLRKRRIPERAFAVQTLKDGLWHATLVRRAATLDARLKWRVVMLIGLLTVASVLEQGRLLLGGKPRRS